MPGTDLASVDEPRRHAGNGAHPLDTVAKLNTSAAFPSGAHAAEVEIDPDTGAASSCATSRSTTAAGQNHALVEGQLHGGSMQGIGQIFGEECVYDRDSQL